MELAARARKVRNAGQVQDAADIAFLAGIVRLVKRVARLAASTEKLVEQVGVAVFFSTVGFLQRRAARRNRVVPAAIGVERGQDAAAVATRAAAAAAAAAAGEIGRASCRERV